MIDRIALAKKYNWEVQEIYRARDAWRKLYFRQPKSEITFQDYLDLIVQSGLRPAKIGKRKGQFHLARYNDIGAYSLNNCRFIPQEENQRERKEGYQRKPEFRALASEIALRRKRTECSHCGKAVTPGMYARWHGDMCKEK